MSSPTERKKDSQRNLAIVIVPAHQRNRTHKQTQTQKRGDDNDDDRYWNPCCHFVAAWIAIQPGKQNVVQIESGRS